MEAMKVLCIVVSMALVICLSANPSAAVLVTSIPGGTITAMPGYDFHVPSPQTFGPGIIWSATNASQENGALFGYIGGYGFAANGQWDLTIGPMAGLGYSYAANDSMTFQFTTPVAGVGGFLNYVPFTSTPTTIAVYDSSMNLIETANLTFLTNGGADTGAFYGFVESSADISYFTLANNYIGITGLTTTFDAVPLPTALLLFGPGLVGLAAIRKRFKN